MGRKDDRGGYAVGDVLELHEFDPRSDHYSGEVLDKTVTHMLTPTPDEFFGLKMGHVIMSVR